MISVGAKAPQRRQFLPAETNVGPTGVRSALFIEISASEKAIPLRPLRSSVKLPSRSITTNHAYERPRAPKNANGASPSPPLEERAGERRPLLLVHLLSAADACGRVRSPTDAVLCP